MKCTKCEKEFSIDSESLMNYDYGLFLLKRNYNGHKVEFCEDCYEEIQKQEKLEEEI
jgi:hypothetical protein